MKHRFDLRGPSKTRTPGTGAANQPEHFFRIAQWALLRGGTFTAQELHDRFGMSVTTCYRYVKAWKAVFGTQGPVLRRRGKAEPAPVKLTLDDLLKR